MEGWPYGWATWTTAQGTMVRGHCGQEASIGVGLACEAAERSLGRWVGRGSSDGGEGWGVRSLGSQLGLGEWVGTLGRQQGLGVPKYKFAQGTIFPKGGTE